MIRNNFEEIDKNKVLEQLKNLLIFLAKNLSIKAKGMREIIYFSES